MCGIRTSPGNSCLWLVLNEDQDPPRPHQKLSLAVVRHEGSPPTLRLQAWKREKPDAHSEGQGLAGETQSIPIQGGLLG